MSIRMFKVGGAVRDGLLGIKSKDIDFAVEAPSFEAMQEHVTKTCKQVFLIKPEFLTIRALHKELGAVDFVMCRKDGIYSDGRRPDSVEPGTILDDLKRRDFTVNAMAIDEEDNLLDPFNGQEDLKNKLIRCVGSAEERFNEDSLRILRAIRFSITKGFGLDDEIWDILFSPKIWVPKLESISQERIQQEIHKCLAHDTVQTLDFLRSISRLWTTAIFSQGLWLKPTKEQV